MILTAGLAWYHPPGGDIGMQPIHLGAHNETANGDWVTWCSFPNEPGAPSLEGAEADAAIEIMMRRA